MPKIDKTKKKKRTNLPVAVKATQKKTSTKIKPSSIDYYNCLLTQAQQGWFNPKTGKKQKITACCKDCKLKAPILSEQRQQEVQKLVVSYQQVGESLKKLLRPLK